MVKTEAQGNALRVHQKCSLVEEKAYEGAHRIKAELDVVLLLSSKTGQLTD